MNGFTFGNWIEQKKRVHPIHTENLNKQLLLFTQPGALLIDSRAVEVVGVGSITIIIISTLPISRHVKCVALAGHTWLVRCSIIHPLETVYIAFIISYMWRGMMLLNSFGYAFTICLSGCADFLLLVNNVVDGLMFQVAWLPSSGHIKVSFDSHN